MSRTRLSLATVVLLAPATFPQTDLVAVSPEVGSTGSTTALLDLSTGPFLSSTTAVLGVPKLAGVDVDPFQSLVYATGGKFEGGNLYLVDPDTGSASLIGPTGFPSVAGLAFDPGGTLFGSASSVGGLSDTLVSIDLESGSATSIGSFGAAGLDGIAVEPSTGKLYGTSGFAYDGSPGDVFEIDTETGLATVLGALAESGTGQPLSAGLAGLAFDFQGNLFGSTGSGTGDVLSIDLDALTFVNLGNAGTGGSVSGLTEAPMPCGGYAQYGYDLGGANTLFLGLEGSPTPGGTLIANTSGLVPGGGAFTGFSLAPSALPLFGGTLLIDPVSLFSTPFAPADVDGNATLAAPIPSPPGLVGFTIYLQSLGLDPFQPAGLAFSNGVSTLFCASCGCEGKYPTLEIVSTGTTLTKLTTPDCDGAMPLPQVNDGLLHTGQQASPLQDVGVSYPSSEITVKLVGADDKCCKKCRVSFIQNLLSTERTGEYEGGAKIEVKLKGTADCKPPLVDAPSTTSPWYPSVKGSGGHACNTDFKVSMLDRPGTTFPLEQSGKKLLKVTQVDTFVTFLVLACPANSGSFSYQYYWEWKVEHSYELENNDGTKADVKAGYKACATTTKSGTGKGTHKPKTTGKNRVDCIEVVQTGF